MTSNSPILTVEDLRVGFPTPRGTVEAVRGISFTIGRNKVGIVGDIAPAEAFAMVEEYFGAIPARAP